MTTPIADFVRRYANSETLRLHMPGHKGQGELGLEALDLTEIHGADSLYEADGIIAESEKNASQLFGCPTFYSTEGSSLCIRAMLFLLNSYAKEQGRAPLILAGRNAHKTFMSGVALLDLEVEWLYSEGSYLSCTVSAEELDCRLMAMDRLPVAVYLTAPDYLGNCVDWELLAAVCHRHGVLLTVDCAHGAYLRFLNPSKHPMDGGVDLCCASAHKTLPVLTGGAYLHVAKHAPACLGQQAKHALAIFGSTSPSYLILQSLDCANAILAEDYPRHLQEFAEHVLIFRKNAEKIGYVFEGDESTKLTIKTKAYGYLGTEFASLLREQGLECEFADRDYTVLMLTPEIGLAGLERLDRAMRSISGKPPIDEPPPAPSRLTSVMSVREAMLSPLEYLPIEACEGMVLASANVGCPPAVPLAICGERIDRDAIQAFSYYGVQSLWVVKNL